MGDLLSAEIGPDGRSSVSTATPQGCSSWVEFETSKLDEFTTTDRFDALVGRYVLLYQLDPVLRYPLAAAFRETGRHRRLP